METGIASLNGSLARGAIASTIAGLAAWAVLSLAGCGPTIEIDLDETLSQLDDLDGPTVEFDPAAGIVPFPNDLLRDDNGIVTLPESCDETAVSRALREQVLNRLDGFGTFEPTLTVSFTARPPTAVQRRLRELRIDRHHLHGAPIATGWVQPLRGRRPRWNHQ